MRLRPQVSRRLVSGNANHNAAKTTKRTQATAMPIHGEPKIRWPSMKGHKSRVARSGTLQPYFVLGRAGERNRKSISAVRPHRLRAHYTRNMLAVPVLFERCQPPR